MFREEWDGVAPFWRCVESRGLAHKHLQKCAAYFDSPVLVVGAGQGLLMESLCRLGYEVQGIDQSEKMASCAIARRGFDISVMSAAMLEFPSRSFASVVVATGVLIPDYPSTARKILSECTRVCRKGGAILVSALATSEDIVEVIRRLGLLKKRTYDLSRIHRLWLNRRHRSLQIELIAAWTRTRSELAAQRFERCHSLIGELLDSHSTVIDCLTISGTNVDIAIKRLSAIPAQPFYQHEIRDLLQYTSLDPTYEIDDNTSGVYLALIKCP